MKHEYKGYELTHHKDGSFSVGWKILKYGLANGETAHEEFSAKTLEELQTKIDGFISECEAKDKAYHASLAELSKQITETHNQVELGVKTAKEKTLEALLNAIKCGELLTQAKDLMEATGKWQVWLKENCPGVTVTTDKRYRQLYRKVKADGSYVSQATSIRQAYILYGMVDATPKPKKKDDTTPPPAPEGNDLSKVGTNVSVEIGEAETPDVVTPEEEKLFGKLVDKILNMDNGADDGEQFDRIMNKAIELLNHCVLEELVSAVLVKANDLEKEDALEGILPLVNWYNEHKPKKSKEEILKETPEALAA